MDLQSLFSFYFLHSSYMKCTDKIRGHDQGQTFTSANCQPDNGFIYMTSAATNFQSEAVWPVEMF